jgi:hypothetical protein
MVALPASLARRADCVTRAAVFATTGGFLALIALAMRAYPGGTAWNPTTSGHDFWLNYLCDLERSTALDGRSNTAGASFARTAMVLIGMGSFPFWHLLTDHFRMRPALARAVWALGAVSSAGLIAVGLLPADAFPDLHPLLMLGAGGPGIMATALGTVGLVTPGRRFDLATLGAAAVVVSTADLALYASELNDPSPGPMAAAVLERIALGLALAWRTLVAWSATPGLKKQ